ncbi:hypothetical protein [Clostridium sp. C105KSO13]|uniref:hypothetical protein n=1 Tax=Clostridium sp. C105KSO13 TaxID=1776045 RepID=UPI0007405EC9|nr:hypothetical protein [Clostridium sp. C105KSO13]CUX28062.1 hypothetical protein BN3456_01034 [Clostridium sp. C105KSO13]
MKFNCVKDFHVDTIDENGFCTHENNRRVRKGSMWELEEDCITLTGADLHLENLTGTEWIEISKERLLEYFEVIECEEQCRKDVCSCDFWDTRNCKLH